MASAGTLLSDLDNSPGGGDGDLVHKILQDMSIPSGSHQQQRQIPPSLPAATPSSYQMAASTTGQFSMDSTIPTSHIIGNEHPTPADFAAAMTGAARPQESVLHQQMGGMAAPVDPSHMMPGAYPMHNMQPMNPLMPMQQAAPQPMQMPMVQSVQKNLYSRLLDEAKIPAFVAILFFVFSLPPIRVLFSHYLPRVIKPTGEFYLSGLFLVACIVGGTFWFFQRVIAPLLSL
jgi:hypothetical protein